MISYKIDKQSLNSINKEIKDMASVLSEITPTLQILQKHIARHEHAISSPSIETYRDELAQFIAEAVDLGRDIAERSQKLVAVSDQAGKHLSAVEEHFGAVLRATQPVQTADAARVN